jgi:hypothetical protein
MALADAVFSLAVADDIVFAAAGALPAAARRGTSLYRDALAEAAVVARFFQFAAPAS